MKFTVSFLEFHVTKKLRCMKNSPVYFLSYQIVKVTYTSNLNTMDNLEEVANCWNLHSKSASQDKSKANAEKKNLERELKKVS